MLDEKDALYKWETGSTHTRSYDVRELRLHEVFVKTEEDSKPQRLSAAAPGMQERHDQCMES